MKYSKFNIFELDYYTAKLRNLLEMDTIGAIVFADAMAAVVSMATRDTRDTDAMVIITINDCSPRSNSNAEYNKN